jgi:hypothetical protein
MTQIEAIFCTCAEPFWRETMTAGIFCLRCGYYHGYVEPPPPEAPPGE